MRLIDSNVLIYYLDGEEKLRTLLEKRQDTLFVSVISVTELLAKPGLSGHDIHELEKFLNNFMILEFSVEIAKEAASLKREYGLKFPDAIIAATALFHDLTVVSRDKIFKRIKKLKTIDPFAK